MVGCVGSGVEVLFNRTDRHGLRGFWFVRGLKYAGWRRDLLPREM